MAVEVYRHDVIVVGGGAAGLRAAIAAVEADPKASIAMVSKVYPMRSHTVSAEGGAAAYVPGSEDSLEKHLYDTIKGSDFLADQDCAEYFVEQATAELTRLEHWGCPWSRNDDGSVATRPFGGMSDARALAILRELFPDREIVGIDCADLVSGFGAIHCVTQQEPAGSRSP